MVGPPALSLLSLALTMSGGSSPTVKLNNIINDDPDDVHVLDEDYGDILQQESEESSGIINPSRNELGKSSTTLPLIARNSSGVLDNSERNIKQEGLTEAEMEKKGLPEIGNPMNKSDLVDTEVNDPRLTSKNTDLSVTRPLLQVEKNVMEGNFKENVLDDTLAGDEPLLVEEPLMSNEPLIVDGPLMVDETVNKLQEQTMIRTAKDDSVAPPVSIYLFFGGTVFVFMLAVFVIGLRSLLTSRSRLFRLPSNYKSTHTDVYMSVRDDFTIVL